MASHNQLPPTHAQPPPLQPLQGLPPNQQQLPPSSSSSSHYPPPHLPVPPIPSTCPHLNNFYDSEFYYRSQALSINSYPPPPLSAPLADLAMLFSYLHHVTSTHRRVRCQHLNCNRYSGRLMACIGCMFIACYNGQHIHHHAAQCRHWCAVDVERGSVYCFHCRDYVYHKEIIKLQERARSESLRRRRQREEALLSPYDQQRLRQHSTPHYEHDLLLGLRGIHNLGNTCFLSVILQVLVHNPLLRNYFLSDLHNPQRCQLRRNVSELKDGGGKASICLACDMDDVFVAFYSGDHTPFGPQRFLISMWTHAEHLAGYAQQDAHELYMSLLDGLHHYTHQPDSSNPTCQCVVHTIFGGQLRSDVQCGTCQTVSTALDPMFDISVDLSSTTAGSSLVDCLRRFTLTEKLWKHDSFLCRRCNQYSEATKQLSFHALPLVLSLHFKRFERTSGAKSHKIDTFIQFPLTALDLSPYLHTSLPTPLSPSVKGREGEVRERDKRQQSAMYDLLSVVVHKGNLETGHYLCYFKHGGVWYRNDDKVIHKVTEVEVSQCHAYLLFYQRSPMPI